MIWASFFNIHDHFISSVFQLLDLRHNSLTTGKGLLSFLGDTLKRLSHLIKVSDKRP